MEDAIDLVAARKWFAEDVREVAPVVHNQAIVDAFATVPRESYLGNGPWGIHSRLSVGEIHQSKSGSAHHLYHDVLISIDETSGINNGLPSLWARVFDSLDINAGATVVQVGAGVGYYTCWAIARECRGEYRAAVLALCNRANRDKLKIGWYRRVAASGSNNYS